MKFGYCIPSVSPYYPEPPYQYQNNKGLNITFRTTPEALRELTPAPLLPNPDNLAFFYVGEFHVAFPVIFNYLEAGIGIPAAHGETLGSYFVYLYLDSAFGIVAGREIWGFPKKDAEIIITEKDDMFDATVLQGDVTLVRASIKASEKVDPVPALTKGLGFNLKIIPSAKPKHPPDVLQLTSATLTTERKELFKGKTSLSLNSSPSDRLGDIPVLEIVDSVRYTQDLTLDYGNVIHDYLVEKNEGQ